MKYYTYTQTPRERESERILQLNVWHVYRICVERKPRSGIPESPGRTGPSWLSKKTSHRWWRSEPKSDWKRDLTYYYTYSESFPWKKLCRLEFISTKYYCSKMFFNRALNISCDCIFIYLMPAQPFCKCVSRDDTLTCVFFRRGVNMKELVNEFNWTVFACLSRALRAGLIIIFGCWHAPANRRLGAMEATVFFSAWIGNTSCRLFCFRGHEHLIRYIDDAAILIRTSELVQLIMCETSDWVEITMTSRSSGLIVYWPVDNVPIACVFVFHYNVYWLRVWHTCGEF